MKKKPKQKFLNFVLAIISLIMALFIGELVFKAVLGEKMALFPRYHTDAKYGKFTLRKIKPNFTFKHQSPDGVFRFKTNNKGFRNNYDVTYDPPINTLRVISIGDSHTQGYEVNQEETFSFICEQRLNKFGLKAQVLNAGVSGFSTAEELAFLENEGIKYKPDYVILGFYQNDFEDNIKSGLFKLENGSLRTVKTKHLPGIRIQNTIYKFKVFKFLGENSYMYAFAFNSVWNFFKKRLAKKDKGKLQVEYAIPTKEVSQAEMDLQIALIKRMFNFCQKNNIQLIILDIPTYELESSVGREFLPMIRNYCHKLLTYDDLADKYDKLSRVHVPNGHRHISSETHFLLGTEAADFILSDQLKQNQSFSLRTLSEKD
ncbi:hypothetical protein E1171_12755 [Cytophagales bacterium RKSG123]|nr:hypothetical protein [Xanthovirga aplysinae]